MADSVSAYDSESSRHSLSKTRAGNAHKGHYGVVAGHASIPSKYQTIVCDNSDKKGFMSQTKRFMYDSSLTESPSPGTYGTAGLLDNKNPSFSKKGTGSFASKSPRQRQIINQSGQGPGFYELPSLLTTRKDFNRSQVERLFQLPIAQTRQKTNGVPAPNAYKVLKHTSGKSNNVTANAAFKSKSRRELLNLSENTANPAPGQYEVNDTLLHDSVKVPVSSFKSTSKRQMQPDADVIPGPGAYSPYELVEQPSKMVFPKKHYLCISAPAIPLPPTPPSPGPGAYNIPGFQAAPKRYISSAAFVSSTGRWTVPYADFTFPGPAHYRPVRTGKQSFIYNTGRRWI